MIPPSTKMKRIQESQHKRMKLAKVCSYRAYQWLENWCEDEQSKYPLQPKDYFYSVTNNRQYLSKFIESVMLKVLRSLNCDPIKAVDSGKVLDTRKTVISPYGGSKTIGSRIYVKDSRVKVGRTDIKCFFNGEMWNYEVKVGKDRMSPEQKKEKARCEANGEKHAIIKTVDDFLNLI